MRVLVFAPSVGRGGISRVTECLLPALSEQGVDLTILGQRCNEIGLPVQYPPEANFIQIRPTGGLPSHPRQFPFLVEHAQGFVDQLAVLAQGYDLIFALTPAFSIGLAEQYGIETPLVACIQDFAFDHVGMGDYLDAVFRRAMPKVAERAALTIFSSNFQKEWGETHYNFNPTCLIRYGAHFVSLAAGDEQVEGLPERYLLAFHVMDHKDPETILRGYALAKQSNASLPPLVLAGIGSDDLLDLTCRKPLVERLRTLVTYDLHLRLGRDLVIAGFVPEGAIRSLYSHAEAVITASRSEGDLSGTLNEGILYKRPIIYSDLPVFAEQLESGKHGLSFPLGDAEALATAINAVVNHPASAALRSERAFLDLTQRTVEDVALDFVAAFESVLGEAQ